VIGRRDLAILIVAATVATTSCSRSGDLDMHTQRQLAAGVQQVQAAVARADRVGARAALRDLTQAVTSLTEAGRLDQDRANEILTAAQGVADHLSLLPAPPTPSPSPEPTTTAPVPSGEQGDSNGPGNGPENGEGNGHGNGNGNGNAYGHDGDHGNGND
jgi:hypothetical protein